MSKEKEKRQYKYYTKALRCPDGSRKYIRGKTQKELDEKVRKAQLELDRGININDNTTFGQFAQMWVDVFKRPYLRENSLCNILNRVNKYMMPVLGQLKMRDIRSAHIMVVMQGASGLSKSSQSHLIGELRTIFNMALDNQIIARSPVPTTLKPAGAPRKRREPLTPEECSRLLEIAHDLSEQAYTFALLCLYAGLRSGEARGLCWDCVDFQNERILVRRQVSSRTNTSTELTELLKTAAASREVPLHPVLAAHLRSIKPHANSITVIGPVMSQNGAAYCFECLSRRIGFHVHPHLLRHTYTTRLVESGSLDIKEVQYLLGHTTAAMTMDVYAHYDRKSRESATAAKVANVSFAL